VKRSYDYLIGNKHAKGHKPNRTAFTKEHVPWNRGKTGIHLSPSTEFKPGIPPVNKMQVGDVTLRLDKNGAYRWWIKQAEPDVWIRYANWVWMKHYGPVSSGMLVHHKDKDSMNDNIENLCLVTRSEHAILHKENLLLARRRLREPKIALCKRRILEAKQKLRKERQHG